MITQVTIALEFATAGEAMHRGVIAVAPDTDVRSLAATMATNRVHCVAVEEPNGTLLGIVSDADLVEALDARTPVDARRLACSEVVTVDAEQTLDEVVHAMVGHEVTHLVVTRAGRPAGIISTLDVAAVAANA